MASLQRFPGKQALCSLDNGAYDKHMSCCDQLRDLDGLQTKPDKDLQTSHSTTSESILDDRIHLAVEQTQDANLSSFSSHRASLVDKADDTMEDKDNSASEIMDYSTSVGPDEGAKHSEECTLSAEDAEEKEEIDEGDKVSVMKILHNDVASDSSGVGVQSDLKDTVTAATVNFSSKNLITDSREPDLKICQVHDEQTGGPEGLKPLEESHHSIPSGPIESDADSGDSVGVSKATDSSLPIAGVVPSNVQVQEDILLMDGSGSGSVLEGPTIDQSSLREESTTEKHQDIELASTECAAKDVGPHELTFHKDSLNAESAVVNTISSKNLFGGSNEMEVTNASLTESEQLCSLGKDEIEATNLSLVENEKHCSLGKDGTGAMNVGLAENEQHFSLGKDDSSHQLSHEVSPETSAVPTAGDNVSDSLEGAEEATETPHGILSAEKDSGCDLPYELISETPRSSIADCSGEAQVLVNNSNGWPNSDRDSHLNLSHEVIKENSTVLVSGGNVAESVEGAEVLEKAVTSGGFDSDRNFGHDSSHKIMPEISIQPMDGSENAYSIDKAEVHETSTIHANGPDIACEETKANQTNVGGKYSQEGASDEASPSVIATIPESLTDDSKISSLHYEVLETDKLEKNKDFALGSKEMAVEGGPAPYNETADWGHAEHHGRELKMDWSIEAGENQLDMQNRAPEEIVSLSTGTGSCIQGSSVLENCTEEDFAARDVSKNHTHSVPGEGGDAVLIRNMNASILATDASVSSVSQDDSLEGHWGSISGSKDFKELEDHSGKRIRAHLLMCRHMGRELPPGVIAPSPNPLLVAVKAWETQSELINSSTIDANIRYDIPTPKEVSDPSLKNGSTSGGIHADNSDVFEAPSFMTLVEPNKGNKRQATSEIQSAQKPASPSSQPGWFPSLMHVVNESQGRKKNEEIIEKVVNWSPGKPHTPLRNLLVEANIESKHKPSQKIQDRASPAPREEHALQEKGTPAKTGNTEVLKETTAKGDIEKEWSSPARLPVVKRERERRKVRGWVPFLDEDDEDMQQKCDSIAEVP
ncbi:hypothetical protein ACLOJK_022729 [Asimina triloba]